MTTRYEYDLDHNGQWRWIATAGNDDVTVSPEGYAHLQDCLHAIALMQDTGGFAILSGVEEAQAPRPAEPALARLEVRRRGPAPMVGGERIELPTSSV